MSDIGNKVVFIIQPYEGSQFFREQWSKIVRGSVLKLLHYFDDSVSQKSSLVQNPESKQLKWAYKFMTSGQKLYRAKQDLKEFNSEEFSYFEDEVSYLAKEEKEDQNSENAILADGAHMLSEELMSVVHDYTWETSDIVSPIKLKAKRKKKSFPGNKKRLSKENMKRKESIFSRTQAEEKRSKNFVVLLCPMPIDQAELTLFFEWHVDTVEYVSNKLMPSHLNAHFRDKHDITLMWVDTRPLCDQGTWKDEAGLAIMEKFLSSIDGCLLPCSLLSSDSLDKSDILTSITGDNVFEELSSLPTCSNATTTTVKGMSDIFPTSLVLDYFLRKDERDTSDENCYIVHVCRKKLVANDSFQIEKLWSIKAAPLSVITDGTKEILCQPCTDCTSGPNSDENQFCDVSFASKDTHCEENSMCHMNVTFQNRIIKNSIPDNCAKPESVFIIMGVVSMDKIAHIMKNDALNSLNSMWCTIIPAEDLCTVPENSHFMPRLQKSDVYVVKMHKYCTACGSEPSVDQSTTSRYALLQIVTKRMAFILWLSSTSGPTIVKLLHTECNGGIDQNVAPTSDQQVQSLVDIRQENTDKEKISTNPNVFHPGMLEKWFQSVCTFDGKLQFPCNGLRNKKEDKKFHIDILNEIQNQIISKTKIANRQAVQDAERVSQEKQVTSENDKIPVCNEFESEESMVAALRIEYNKALEIDVDTTSGDAPAHYCQYIVQTVQSLVSVLFHHASNAGDTDWKNEADMFVRKHFLCTATDIRKRNIETDNGKLQESILQILLRLELASRIPLDEDSLETTAEEISFLLRLISLSANPATMKRCLSHVFVDNYTTTCGELLCEVYNELMQPIPPQLKSFAKDASEESYLMSSSVKTVLDSIPNSNPSLCSSAGPESYNRRSSRTFKSFAPKISRQIEVPGAMKPLKLTKNDQDTTSGSTDSIKHRLRSSTKKEKPERISGNGAKEMGRVKRDLFAANETVKEIDATVKSKSNDPDEQKSSRRMSVSDTPDAKQRMTALSRQRQRLRREKIKEDDGDLLGIIEESPAKQEQSENRQSDLKRSPRHRIMLTRRHSFYREGKESRTVARAKIIQQHQQAAPPTPVASRKEKQRLSADAAALFSPNSLLFVRNSQTTFLSPNGKEKPNPICGESPAKNTRSHATKALFQSPVREVKTPTRKPRREQLQQMATVVSEESDVVQNEKDDNVFIFGIEPILPSPMKTPQKSVPNSCLKTPIKNSPLCPPSITPAKKSAKLRVVFETPMKEDIESTKLELEISDTNHEIQANLYNTELVPETILDVADPVDKQVTLLDEFDLIPSPKSPVFTYDITSRASTSTESIKTGTMDDFVIRTPNSKPRSRNSCVKVRQTKKRKWSIDTTPTRDDINQWPRKKRGVDKSSPGVVSKRSKKSVADECEKDNACLRKNEFVLNESVCDNNNSFASPDHGLFILDDVAGSSKAVSCSAVKQPPPLREIVGQGTDSNENIIQQPVCVFNDLKLPPTPKLRLGISRRPTQSNCRKGQNSFFNTDVKPEQDGWNDIFPLDSSDNMTKAAKNSIKDSVGISARSLLHIQNSPILTPGSKRQQRSNRNQSQSVN